MAKKIDPIKAKAKRDKIVAAVLGGVLLVACVVAVPMSLKQWKKLNGSGQAQPVATQTTPTPTGVTPSTCSSRRTPSSNRSTSGPNRPRGRRCLRRPRLPLPPRRAPPSRP
jgi:hypothetical protein